MNINYEQLAEVIAEFYNIKGNASKDVKFDLNEVEGLAGYIVENMKEKESFDPDSAPVQFINPKNAAFYYR